MIHNEIHELVRRLAEVGIQPAPHNCRIGRVDTDWSDREVTISAPDGIYFKFHFQNGSDDIQILIVGPMRLTPGEIAGAIHRGYWVKDVQFLKTDLLLPGAAQTVRERGFISIHLRHQNDEMPPSFLLSGKDE